MARPKRVHHNRLHLYDKMITETVKMYNGLAITALHLLKETKHYFISIESWAFCASTFKKKKKYVPELNVDIPVLTNEKSIKILETYVWWDWIDKEVKAKNSEMIETIAFLDKLFPDKEKKFLYELEHLVSAFCHGTLGEYDDEGNKYIDERLIKRTQNYNQKYSLDEYRKMDTEKYPKAIQKLHEAYRAINHEDKDRKDEKQAAYGAYSDATRAYDYEHHNIIDELFEIGTKLVVCPYSFSHGTGMWAIEKYGQPCAYSAAGDIFFVVTEDTVYFEVGRHF